VYGFDQIIEHLGDDVYIEMFDFFVPAIDDEDEDD
jgi:hypothetical protein